MYRYMLILDAGMHYLRTYPILTSWKEVVEKCEQTRNSPISDLNAFVIVRATEDSSLELAWTRMSGGMELDEVLRDWSLGLSCLVTNVIPNAGEGFGKTEVLGIGKESTSGTLSKSPVADWVATWDNAKSTPPTPAWKTEYPAEFAEDYQPTEEEKARWEAYRVAIKNYGLYSDYPDDDQAGQETKESA